MVKVVIIGNVGVDVVLGPLNNWPAWGYEAIVKEYSIRFTGAAGNVATVLSALNIEPWLISAIGKDKFGEIFKNIYSNLGVKTEYLKEIDGSTCISVGVKNAKSERSFITHLGVLEKVHMVKICKNYNFTDAIVLICGINLVPSMRTEEFYRFVRDLSNKAFILMDPGCPLENWNEFREILAKFLPYVDIFLPNEEEFLNFMDVNNLESALEHYHKRYKTTTVIKLGAVGAVMVRDGVSKLVPVDPINNIKDTIGAGDAFNAGLIHALAEKKLLDVEGIHHASTIAAKWISGHFWRGMPF